MHMSLRLVIKGESIVTATENRHDVVEETSCDLSNSTRTEWSIMYTRTYVSTRRGLEEMGAEGKKHLEKNHAKAVCTVPEPRGVSLEILHSPTPLGSKSSPRHSSANLKRS